MPSEIRLGFDARLAGPSHAGIGRYAEAVLQTLLAHHSYQGKDIHWILWVSPEHGMPWLKSLENKNIEVRTTSIRHYSVSEQWQWAWELWRANLDLLYVPHFNVPLLYRKPFIMTLHDLLWHEQKDRHATTLSPLVHGIKRWAYQRVSGSAVRRAVEVVVPSIVVRRAVAKLIGRYNGVTVIPEGVPSVFREAALATGKEEQRCLYIGSLYPHKNFQVILRALQLDPQMHIDVIGVRNVFVEAMQRQAIELDVSDRVQWLGYQTDQEIIARLQRVTALIQPSHAEGFGLTGLEALTVGCSVIASDIPIFREVYGSQAYFFTSDDPAALVAAWQTLQQKRPSAQVRQSWRAYAQQFTWEKTGEALWHALCQAVER